MAKVNDSNDNWPPGVRQTASRSHDQPIIVVDGGPPGPPIHGSATACIFYRNRQRFYEGRSKSFEPNLCTEEID